MKNGLLLINLGTPDHPSISSVRRYLREFLSDKRVISLPAPLRYLLLYGFILPFRTKRSTHAYQTIWTPHGSPLLLNGLKMAEKLQHRLASNYKVVLGMRYGNPSLLDALNQLQDCETLTILPLYPQYSSAATGSSIEKTLEILSSKSIIPNIKVIRDFHNHPGFIKALTTLVEPYIPQHDYLMFSYHGIPSHQLHPNKDQFLCDVRCSDKNAQGCYRTQCLQTTALVAQHLGLNWERYGTAFQSRMGKTPWIKPYTDERLCELAAEGKKRLAIVCPSFVSDCLETLEEIGIRMKKRWLDLGGEELTLIPCLNDSESWLEAIIDITTGSCH